MLLVPVCGGVEKSEQVNDTAAPAPLKVMSAVHTPFAKVIASGLMLPGPVFAKRIAFP